MGLHIFGIRHHGPGSARSLLRALEELQPDCLLIEGPPDAEAVLPLLLHAQMQPPVALLIYQADQPQRAAFYPFALFSPEWQALQFGLRQSLPTRFMDLPQSHWLAMQPNQSAIRNPQSAIQADPIGVLAKAAGYDDSERWWEYVVEHRRDGADIFAAILEAMTVLREEAAREAVELVGSPDVCPEQAENNAEQTDSLKSVPRTLRDDANEAEPSDEPGAEQEELNREALREAWMRQTIRRAQKEGFARIAIVCGAWHAPVLTEAALKQFAKPDAALLVLLLAPTAAGTPCKLNWPPSICMSRFLPGSALVRRFSNCMIHCFPLPTGRSALVPACKAALPAWVPCSTISPSNLIPSASRSGCLRRCLQHRRA